MSWEKKPLKDVCVSISAGGTPSRKNQSYWKDGNIPWVKIGDMKGKYVNVTTEKITEAGLKGSSAKLFPKDSILYSIFATLGSVSILNIEASTNQAIAGLTPDESLVSKEYLYYSLIAEKEAILSKKSHNTQDNINLTILREHEIPVPPLDTQKRIVAILERAEQLKEKRAKANENTQAIIQSLFYDMFGDPLRNEKGWPVGTLGDLGKVSMCKRIFKEQTLEKGDIPFFKIGTFGKEPNAYISKEVYEEYKQKYSFPKKGDVLLSASGTIGRTVVYDGKPAYFQDSNIVWIDNNEEKILNSFLRYFYGFVKWQTDTSTIARLYNTNLRKTKVIFPSLELQKEFTRRVQALESVKIKQQSSTDKISTLFNALMQKTFKGELVA